MAIKNEKSIFDPELTLKALGEAARTLTPKNFYYNPVMFATYVCAILVTGIVFYNTLYGQFSWFEFNICLWLWLTVLFANFARALAKRHATAQATGLHLLEEDVQARLIKDGHEIKQPSRTLKKGDIIVCEAGDVIPADGEVIEGIATIDESAITGESAPVIRESGGDRNAVTLGTRVISDRIIIRVSAEPSSSFLNQFKLMMEGLQHQKSSHEISLTVVLMGFSLILLIAVVTIKFAVDFSVSASGGHPALLTSPPVLAVLLVCAWPTTIAALLEAVSISGISSLNKSNVVVKSGKAVEEASDVDLLLLDKTGTITLGNRLAFQFIPINGAKEIELAEIAHLASLADETPEGRSIVRLAKNNFNIRGQIIDTSHAVFRPFSAKTRMSGVEFYDSQGKLLRSVSKGAPDAIKSHVEKLGGQFPAKISDDIAYISKQGGTPLVVSDHNRVLGSIYLKDILKGGIKERCEQLRKMGIRTLMITGDNPLTATVIAAEAGVDDFVAEATPEMKLQIIRKEQDEGRVVAMTGDGISDAPALAQANVGLAMNTGTQASREASNLIDLDSNPTKLIEVVASSKHMLMTRGALTLFSLFSSLATFFAILPALYGMLYLSPGEPYGPMNQLNILGLATPQSAILSALIFNALIIVAVIPIALRGVHYKTETATGLLGKNMLIYGLGGNYVPLIGIKLIDSIIHWIGMA